MEPNSTSLRFTGVQCTEPFSYFLVLQIKFEHFSSGFTDAVRRNQNASKRTGHGGCLHRPSDHGSKTQHSSHGLRRRRRKTSRTENLPQPRFVTPKVRRSERLPAVRNTTTTTVRAAAPARRCATLSGAVASHYPRPLMRGRVMNSYLKLQFSGFECSHVVETHFLPFSSRFPCQV